MRTLTIALFVALSASLPILSAAAFPALRSVPPESFLVYHVDNVPQLSYEVAYKAVVRRRLAHHFHLTDAAMCSYVREHLVLEHLKAPLRTRVYCISRSGREFYVIMTLKKGPEVFAEKRTGKPILRLVCGNPLVAALPPIPKAAPVKPVRPPVTRVEAANLLQAAPSVAAIPTAAPIITAAPAVFGTAGATQILFTTGAGAVTTAWLTGVPIAAGAVALGSFSGPPSGPPALVPLTPPSGPPTGPKPVPEPAPWLTALVGAACVGARIVVMKRKRSHQTL